jgi:N-acetylglucosaminyldiphosphoundecaprenol N-acetyl-beta-D-mannosaminyltransferase
MSCNCSEVIEQMPPTDPVTWPAKYDVLGVAVSATTYDQAVDTIACAAQAEQPAVVSLHAVHALITAAGDPQLREAVNQFDMIAPDGQPVRWALNRLYHLNLTDRVYGPELMLRLCRRAAEAQIPIYLYGSTQPVLDALCERLPERFAGLRIAGAESPPFRKLTEEEDAQVVRRINESGARIVFIGLGAPKQDLFAHAHRDRIDAVQVCVGAAFDFHAGMLPMAPAWMQRTGLEWLYRLYQEPGRLWKRYLVTNSTFLWKLGGAMSRNRFGAFRNRWFPRQASQGGE